MSLIKVNRRKTEKNIQGREMEVFINELEIKFRQRIRSLNRLGLTAARAVSRDHSPESRFDIPPQLKPCYAELSDEDVGMFAVIPVALFAISGLKADHLKTPATHPVAIDAEYLRRTVILARDMSHTDAGEQSYPRPIGLLGLSREDVAHIKSLTDDQFEELSNSSRVAIQPRIAPENKFKTKDGKRLDGQAMIRRCISELENFVELA